MKAKVKLCFARSSFGFISQVARDTMEGTEIVNVEQKSRRDKSAAGIEPHRWSQHASGHCLDNHFNKTFVQPSRNIALVLGSGMQRLLIKD